ncbi:helix-turn-helix transcriptional regulator [Mycolicibacter minnesotensis]
MPESTADGLSWLEPTLAELVTAHGGVRLIGQDRGDRLAAGFADVRDAMACAIELQRAPSAPVRPRVALHTDEVEPISTGNYPSSLVNRATRLCDLAHGGQTVLSEPARDFAADRLPQGAWLAELGVYRVRGRPFPERVAQLCHRDLSTDFPPLLTGKGLPEPHFSGPLTSFVGRDTELAELKDLVAGNRLVTLTGTGGVGKTRLALQLADALADDFRDGAWCVDLSPITDPDLLLDRVTHTLGLPDLSDRAPAETPTRFLADRQMLLVLDNCEHILDACAQLIPSLLAAGSGLTIVATSREPLGLVGEVTWKTPSLSLGDEAVELFQQRARLVRPGLSDVGDDAVLMADICQRLDGVPLAIELAATRARALSLAEIADGLNERFDLLTGGVRTGVPRQQTLRASEDWSHDLLSEEERVVFRRLAPFVGGFDLDAAHAVAGGELTRGQLIDMLTQLVDKSLVVADNTGDTTRFGMLQTVHQYALEKLEQSGESAAIQARHRDHYTFRFETQASAYQWNIKQADLEIDNLRAAFTWSRDCGDIELAARLASALFPLWVHSRTLEGLAWFKTVFTEAGTMAPAAHARALADKTIFEALTGSYGHVEQAEHAVSIARSLDDPALLAWSLAACGFTSSYNPEVALSYLDQAIALSPAMNDDWRLSQIYGVQAYTAFVAGDLRTMREAAMKGQALATPAGDWSVARLCRLCLGTAHLHRGHLTVAVEIIRQVAIEAEAACDPLFTAKSLAILAEARACQGDIRGARAAADGCVEASVELIDFHRALGFGSLVDALLAAGDVTGAVGASVAALDACALPEILAINGNPVARVALAAGDLGAARRWADQALPIGSGFQRILLLEVRARVALAEGQRKQAERDARDALEVAAETEAYLAVPDLLETLASLACAAGNHEHGVRLLGSAAGIRKRTGAVRYVIYDAGHATTVDALQRAMPQNEFDQLWSSGEELSTADAVAYARRGDGERKRTSSGWAALTPAEHNVIRLVSAGLRDKDIAAKLNLSPRTVHSHLNHIYTKLNISSRLQLAQEAARQM